MPNRHRAILVRRKDVDKDFNAAALFINSNSPPRLLGGYRNYLNTGTRKLCGKFRSNFPAGKIVATPTRNGIVFHAAKSCNERLAHAIDT